MVKASPVMPWLSSKAVNNQSSPLPEWAYASAKPTTTATLKQCPEDFIVIEELGFTPEGEGEHAFVTIEKRNTNTGWLADELARYAGVRQVDVGYAGLKDRNALTTQTFSVNLSQVAEPDWKAFETDEIKVISVGRHPRKLKRGVHQGNRFILTLRDLAGDMAELESRLQTVKGQGVPNYFGEQRFGIHSNNITNARRMFAGEIKVKDRTKKSLYISAARSLLFNNHLSKRVEAGNWNQLLDGDVPMFNGKQRPIDPEALKTEPDRFDLTLCHPTGPLWGSGELMSSAGVAALEKELFTEEPELCRSLQERGLKQERRALRAFAEGLNWEQDSNTLRLEFSLVSGAYATSVIRELLIVAN